MVPPAVVFRLESGAQSPFFDAECHQILASSFFFLISAEINFTNQMFQRQKGKISAS